MKKIKKKHTNLILLTISYIAIIIYLMYNQINFSGTYMIISSVIFLTAIITDSIKVKDDITLILLFISVVAKGIGLLIIGINVLINATNIFFGLLASVRDLYISNTNLIYLMITLSSIAICIIILNSINYTTDKLDKIKEDKNDDCEIHIIDNLVETLNNFNQTKLNKVLIIILFVLYGLIIMYSKLIGSYDNMFYLYKYYFNNIEVSLTVLAIFILVIFIIDLREEFVNKKEDKAHLFIAIAIKLILIVNFIIMAVIIFTKAIDNIALYNIHEAINNGIIGLLCVIIGLILLRSINYSTNKLNSIKKPD